MYGKIALIAGLGALTAACAQGGYQDPRTQRALGGAAIGAGVGALGGAIIADEGDDLEGALIGGAIGAAVGAGVGAATTPDQNRNRVGPGGQQLYFDSRANAYYYVDPRDGRTYWENGTFRGYN